VSAGQQRPLRVVMAAPDARNPGGITAVIAAWRRAGLEREVELVELPTAVMDAPLPLQLVQAARALLRLAAIVARPRRRPDLVHLHASTRGSLYRKLALAGCCRLARVPYVAHLHSGGFDEWVAASARNRRAAAALLGGASATIILARRWEASARELGAGRVEVLANGIPAADRRALAAAGAERAADAGRPGRPVLLFYGRWAPVKGADRLAAALAALARDDYEVRLFGSGDRRWLERCFEPVRGAVRIGGWLGAERKPAELAAAAALVAPSRAEGFPTALVEARAAGTPVIATDVGAVAEALDGYPAAALLGADDEASLRAALGRLLDGGGPERAAEGPRELPPALRAEVAVERLVAIYATIAA
jgi:glycosyltransferase involved in cell wall biosynthesis